MKIYVVSGTTGEYSDRTDWIVCAFTSKEAADKRAHAALLRANEIQGQKGARALAEEIENEFDPYCLIDYTGTAYNVEEVELIESPSSGD